MSKEPLIQPHIHVKTGDVAEYVLLPGDPGRVKRVAEFLDEAKKIAEYRGYLTYTGTYAGIPISATSTGIGCPSAAIVIEELAKAGAKTFIRVGTTGSLRHDIDVGDLVIVTAATRTNGTSRAYAPVEYPAIPSFDVTSALVESAKKLGVKYHLGPVFTSAAFYAEDPEFVKKWSSLVLSVEMECSSLFVIAGLRGLRSGAILAVDGNLVKGTKKREFRPGEEVGESHPKVLEAIDNEIKVALEAIKLLARKA